MSQPQSDATSLATTTAGLRGSHWSADRLPAGVKVSVHSLRASDGAVVNGYLFMRGEEKTVCCLMHPRELVVTSYLVPEILQGGCAVWVQGARNVGNDIRLEHETAILDLAAGQCFLREQVFEKRVLVGVSGGASLAAYYNQQARLAPAERIARSPAGRPTQLAEAEMPVPDGFVLISPHRGQGKLLQGCIDPAVIDENDPLASDDSLSAFNPKNGWKPPPESSSFSPEFLERYRAAQIERVKRIDAFARKAVERKQAARKRSKESPNRADAVLAAWSPIFMVWRTDADPRCFDLSLDPNDRVYGTLWGGNPVASNYGSVGFARVCTPESWLSTWSANASSASMDRCAPALAQPTLMVQYTGDNSLFPTDADAIFGYIGAVSKMRVEVKGNHQGQPIRPGDTAGQMRAGEVIRAWLAEHGFC